MNTKKYHTFFILFALAIFLAGCGSDDIGKAPDLGLGVLPPVDNPHLTNNAPTAIVAVYPNEVMFGQKITLDGTGSYDQDDDAITYYKWTKSGNVTKLDGADTAVATMIAPMIATTLKFSLTIADEHGRVSAPAEVTIEVKDFPPPTSDAIVASSTVGKDSNSGSYVSPVATIGKAIALAGEKGLSNVYVMEGTYSETVALKNGINLTGGIVSFEAGGNPVFSTATDKTTILNKVMASGVDEAVVKNFKINGSAVLENSFNINIEGNSFEQACTDIIVSGGTGVSVTGNHFVNNGDCSEYVAVDINDSEGTKVVGSNYFALRLDGNEDRITVIQSVGGAKTEISEGVIARTGTAVNDDLIFAGISVSGTSAALINDNSISLAGGKASTGVAVNCTDGQITVDVEGNNITLWSATAEVTGVRVNCQQPNSIFNIAKNLISVEPAEGEAGTVKGVDVSSLLRPITLNVINNIVAMPVVANDLSGKTAIYLSKVGSASDVNIVFNTTYLTGNQGELHSVYSDVGTLPISSLGNIFMVYGSNDNNSVFSLRSECFTNYCVKELEANLISAKFFNQELPLVYYHNTGAFGGMESANMCDSAPTTPACVNDQTSRKDNIIAELLPAYFDAETWSLGTSYQIFAKDAGPEFTGVADDINNDPRDSKPDIGAVEY